MSKVNTNLISGKTTIVDGYIQGNKVSSVNNEPNTPSYMNAGSYFITELLKIPANTKISHITIGVNDSLNVGDTVSGVVVGFAKYLRTEHSYDKRYQIDRYIMKDGKGTVHKNTDTNLTCNKAVSIVIDEEVTEELVLIIGCEGAIWGDKVGSVTGGLAFGGGSAPAEGTEVALVYGNYVGKVSIYAYGTALKDMSNNITTNSSEIQDIKNNKVDKTQIGNTAGKIPQIDGSGKLEASIMPSIAITDVHVVQDSQAMMQLTVQVGDVVVVQNEGNKTYMCKDPSQSNKDQKFIEINTGYPVVKKVNNVLPSNTGELSINGTQINVDGQVTSPTIAEEFKKYVKSVNGETPRADGNVTIYARQISGTYNQSGGTVQSHLDTIKNSIDSASNRIATLERKVPPIRVGELIQTFAYNGDSYSQGGVEYVWLGKQNNLVQRAKYPALFDAFGLASGINAFNLPHIADQSVQFDYGKSRYRKTYIVAKIS